MYQSIKLIVRIAKSIFRECAQSRVALVVVCRYFLQSTSISRWGVQSPLTSGRLTPSFRLLGALHPHLNNVEAKTHRSGQNLVQSSPRLKIQSAIQT